LSAQMSAQIPSGVKVSQSATSHREATVSRQVDTACKQAK
jgi:hypothetical protein